MRDRAFSFINDDERCPNTQAVAAEQREQIAGDPKETNAAP
jgi:hypothetical protein